MKILYIDLNQGYSEDYSQNPKRYGGGACVAREMVLALNNENHTFHIATTEEGFVSMEPDERRVGVPITENDKEKLRNGEPLKNIILTASDYDIVFHHFHNYSVNLEGLKAKQVVWLVGYGEVTHEKLDNILIYSRQYQNSLIGNPQAKLYDVIIGKPLPEFKAHKKSDFIFYCGRHTNEFNSIQIAEFCKKYKIKGIFAGQVPKDYPLLEQIDNKYTFSLGEISEDLKIEYYKNAKLTMILHGWPTPFSLSAIEALSHGCPVACNLNTGFWATLIRDGVNGFNVNQTNPYNQIPDPNGWEVGMLRAWNNASYISQLVCWQSVLQYDCFRMVRSFTDAFNEILKK